MDDPFADSRSLARTRAADTLREQNFIEQNDGSFDGELSRGDQHFDIRVELPVKFPDSLPEVRLKNLNNVTRRAHIERNGKLCLFPHTGVLIDISRPEQIVLQSLDRANTILFEAEDDYREEFLAYWRQQDNQQLISIVTDLCNAHPLSANNTLQNFLVVGDNSWHLMEWLRRVGWKTTLLRNAYLIPLRELPDAPSFGTITYQRDILNILEHYAENDDRASFEAWLKTKGLPVHLFLTAPGIDGARRVVFAAELRRAEGKAAIRLHKGFRAGNMPVSLEVARSKDQPAIRIAPSRADSEYLVSRVGGDVKLKTTSVAVIGCGSLGSQIAVNLAASGVGRLTLIDHEPLTADNIHRHALGMTSVGKYKADALRDHLLARLPHLEVCSIPNDVETVFLEQNDILLDHTLIIVATGDETLELRLNALFDASARRIHAWLEPLGIGGHALLTGQNKCYGCAFNRDERGLYNLASLVKRDQEFLLTLDGCASTFTPFGFTDAAQGAVEVARLAIEVLQDKNAPSKLVSWVGNASAFQRAGFKLSRRGNKILTEGRFVEYEYGQTDCEVCSAV